MVNQSNIVGIYDNGGRSVDRYTVVASDRQGALNVCLSMSAQPDRADGFSQWGECDLSTVERTGKRVDFYSLPDRVQKHITKRMEVELV